MLDERWIRALHVETMREEELHAEHEPHVLFQASTIAALLDGAYDGDLTFAELAEHGDLGLGTLNGLDGEMIALDGYFYRADGRRRRRGGGAGRADPVRRRHRVHADDRGDARRAALPRGPARRARCADARRRGLLRDPARRALRVGPGALGAAPASALPAADRGRRRTARVRARRRHRDDARLPVPELRRGDRGRRLPPPLHRRRPPARWPRPRLADRRGAGPASTPRTISTSSCRPPSTSPTPISPPRPTQAVARVEGRR